MTCRLCLVAVILSALGLILLAFDMLARWMVFWEEPYLPPGVEGETKTWTYETSVDVETARNEGRI